jgi:hypothetical protein
VDRAEDLVREWLRAFERLDLEPFVAAFVEDGTAFLPFTPRRRVGREATRPPAVGDPDLVVQPLGPHGAVASFHYGTAGEVRRRSLILVERDGRWGIAHLHASNLPE